LTVSYYSAHTGVDAAEKTRNQEQQLQSLTEGSWHRRFFSIDPAPGGYYLITKNQDLYFALIVIYIAI